MHTIKRIAFDGVKVGPGREYTFAPRTLIVGPPYSGKTRIAQAVQFAVLGYIPTLGKTERATALAMSERSMGSLVTLDDDRTFGRTLHYEGKSLKNEARALWMPTEADPTEVGDAIVQLFGRTGAEAEQHLDIRKILGAKPAERCRMLESMLDGGGAGEDENVLVWRVLSLARLTGGADPRELDTSDIDRMEQLERGFWAIAEPKHTSAFDGDVVLGIGEILEKSGIGEAASAARKAKLDTGKTVKNKREARTELEERVAESGRPAEDLDELRSRHRTISDRVAVAKDRASTAAEASKRSESLRSSLSSAISEVERLSAGVEEARSLGASEAIKVKASQKQLSEMTVPPPPEMPEARLSKEHRDELDRVSGEATKRKRAYLAIEIPDAPVRPEAPDNAAESEARRAEVRAKTALAKARSNPWAEVRKISNDLDSWNDNNGGATSGIIDRIARLRAIADKEGPTQRQIEDLAGEAVEAEDAVGRAVEAHARAVSAHGESLDEFEADVAARNGAIKRQEVAKAAWDEACQIESESRARIQEEFDTETRLAGESFRKAREAHQKASNEYDALREKIRELKGRTTASVIDAERELEDARRIAVERQSAVDALAPLDDTSELAEQIATDSAELSRLNETIALVEREDARVAEMEALAAELLDAEALLDVLKSCEFSLSLMRERDLASRGGDLLARVGTFLKGAGLDVTPTMQANKSSIRFGWKRGEYDVDAAAMSGCEFVMFSTAVVSAVLAIRKPEVGCVIIEGAEAGGGEHAAALLRGIDAVADDLGSFLVLSCISTIEVPEGWACISTA